MTLQRIYANYLNVTESYFTFFYKLKYNISEPTKALYRNNGHIGIWRGMQTYPVLVSEDFLTKYCYIFGHGTDVKSEFTGNFMLVFKTLFVSN